MENGSSATSSRSPSQNSAKLRNMSRGPPRPSHLRGPVQRGVWRPDDLGADGVLASERPDALFVDIDPFFTCRRVQLVNLASHHAIPATYPGRQFTEIGGLMSYGSDLTDAWRQVGV